MSDRGYSMDLRVRVMDALESGVTQEEAAQLFAIGIATVYRWRRLQRETGDVQPRPHGGGNTRALDDSMRLVLRRLVKEKSDRTLAELGTTIRAECGCSVSDTTVFRELRRLGFSRKKSRSRPRNGSVLTSSGG